MAELEPEEEPRGRRIPAGAIALAGVAAAAGALFFSRRRHTARVSEHENALRRLAEEIRGELTPAQPGSPQGPDFPSLAGTHRGRPVRVDTEVAGTPLNYQCLTRTTAEHAAPVAGFVIIREETILTRMADRLGLTDVQVGESAFDDRFEVTSDLPDAVRLLQPEVRDALLAARFESCVIRQGEVTVRQVGPVVGTEPLRQSLKLAVDIAEWLETWSAAPVGAEETAA
ncbi:MAG: hypothetical protein HY321_22710 [Armatimonadetes bacterium]|nr:hypothetical protein [Armatimonadota bacterium]